MKCLRSQIRRLRSKPSAGGGEQDSLHSAFGHHRRCQGTWSSIDAWTGQVTSRLLNREAFGHSVAHTPLADWQAASSPGPVSVRHGVS